MTQFNQELITKARKGEIAILNDGSLEELRGLLKEVFPNDCTTPRLTSGSKFFMTHFHNTDFWQCDTATHLRAHSVKDFFMPDIKDKPIFRKENEGHQPRTYKVTRSQMKEIWDKTTGNVADQIKEITGAYFDIFKCEATLYEATVNEIVSFWDSYPDQRDFLRSIFPSYFYIPEGEPVLCRDSDGDDWMISISDGTGSAYSRGRNYGTSTGWKQIIPFTKTPPK